MTELEYIIPMSLDGEFKEIVTRGKHKGQVNFLKLPVLRYLGLNCYLVRTPKRLRARSRKWLYHPPGSVALYHASGALLSYDPGGDTGQLDDFLVTVMETVPDLVSVLGRPQGSATNFRWAQETVDAWDKIRKVTPLGVRKQLNRQTHAIEGQSDEYA